MGYIYSNPFADAANAMSGGMQTLGDTALKMAMLRQSGQQRQQDLMMQLAQMQMQQQAQAQQFGLQNKQFGLQENKFNFDKTQALDKSKQDTLDYQMKLGESQARTGVDNAQANEMRQRVTQVMMLQNVRESYAKHMSMVGQPSAPATGLMQIVPQSPSPFSQVSAPAVGLQPDDMGALQGEIAQLSRDPGDAQRSMLMLQAIQNGAASDPSVQRSVLTGFAPRTAPVDPLSVITLKALLKNLSENTGSTDEFVKGLGGLGLQGALGQQTKPVVAPPHQRQVGEQVTTAKGTFRWNGQGWDPVK